MRSNLDPGPACDECKSNEADVLRCMCGSLIARYVRGGIELKCRRCKRTITVPLEDSTARDGQ